MQDLKQEFQDSLQERVMSGSLKFSQDFVSKYDLFVALKKWTESDTNVISAVIRSGGGNQIAVDFRYQLNDDQDPKTSKVDFIKQIFNEYLGGDHLFGWDFGTSITIVK